MPCAVVRMVTDLPSTVAEAVFTVLAVVGADWPYDEPELVVLLLEPVLVVPPQLLRRTTIASPAKSRKERRRNAMRSLLPTECLVTSTRVCLVPFTQSFSLIYKKLSYGNK